MQTIEPPRRTNHVYLNGWYWAAVIVQLLAMNIFAAMQAVKTEHPDAHGLRWELVNLVPILLLIVANETIRRRVPRP